MDPMPSLRRLAAATAQVKVHAGDDLFSEDDHGSDVFIVVTGRLEVLSPGGARPSLCLPGPAATMLRAKELGSKDAHRRRRAAADVLLEPPLAVSTA